MGVGCRWREVAVEIERDDRIGWRSRSFGHFGAASGRVGAGHQIISNIDTVGKVPNGTLHISSAAPCLTRGVTSGVEASCALRPLTGPEYLLRVH